MKGLRKRIIALAAVAALAMTSFVGCASVKDSDIVAIVGDSKITAGMANFYVRMQQPSYEENYVSYQDYYQQMYYGSVLYETEMDWSTEDEDGVTLEETFKEDVMTALQNMYLSEDHMGDYEVSLTDEEMQTIEETAKTFLEANTDEAKETISATQETVTEFLKLYTISEKVDEAIRNGVDQNVSDEEAAQKRLRYVSYALTSTDDDGETVELTEDEIATVKEEANTFLEAAKANGSLEAYATETEETSSTATYGADYEEDTALSLPTEVYAAADALEVNGFAEVVETDSALYVVQLESTLDEDATAEEKESIIEERQDQAVEDTIAEWRENAEIKVYDKVWKKIKLQPIELVQKEVEETTEDTTSEE